MKLMNKGFPALIIASPGTILFSISAYTAFPLSPAMRRRAFCCVFLLVSLSAGFLRAAEEADTWTYWVSGGKGGVEPRAITDDQFAIGVSEGFVQDRAVGFTGAGGIIFLRSGIDVQEPEFADPKMEQIGAVGERKLWKAEYRDATSKHLKALMLLIDDDLAQLHPFFFIAAKAGQKLLLKVEPNTDETKRVSVGLRGANGAPRTFAFKFDEGAPQLVGAKKR
jgi:hypothetical protein